MDEKFQVLLQTALYRRSDIDMLHVFLHHLQYPIDCYDEQIMERILKMYTRLKKDGVVFGKKLFEGITWEDIEAKYTYSKPKKE